MKIMEKLNLQSVEALGLLKLTMVAAGNSRSSITAYLHEIRYLCAYFPNLSPDMPVYLIFQNQTLL